MNVLVFKCSCCFQTCSDNSLLFPAVEIKKEPDDTANSDDVLIVYELTPTPEQRALADSLKLPPTFFCYQNEPGYLSEDDDDGKKHSLKILLL